MATFIIGDYSYSYIAGIHEASVEVVDKTKSSYEDMPDTVTYDGTTYPVVRLNRCFKDCRNLVNAPRLSENAEDIRECFSGCVSLVQAPEIPKSINESYYPIDSLFYNCRELEGNVVFDFDERQMMMNTFVGTTKDIFIVNKGSYDGDLKEGAQSYSNVHFEADDNPIPVISNFTATRVSALGSTTFDATGLYAYVQARLMAYDTLIPVGWTNEVKSIVLKDNGVVESPTWQPVITDYPADVYCWIYLGDTSTHNLSLQITDSIKEDNVEVKSQSSIEAITTISKSYALVDYYHDEVADTEGMAIGKYAEQTDLLDVDMPTLFRQGVSLVDGEAVIRTLLDYMRPIGSTYSTLDPNFDPNDVWGGTWEKLPEGYVLLSGSDSGSYIVGDDSGTSSGYKEYGENSHILTTDEIPAHNHGQKSLTGMIACQSYSNGTPSGIVSTYYKNFNLKATTGANNFGTHNQTINASHTHDSVGGDQAHSLMQKSIAVYWWIRTA